MKIISLIENHNRESPNLLSYKNSFMVHQYLSSKKKYDHALTNYRKELGELLKYLDAEDYDGYKMYAKYVLDEKLFEKDIRVFDVNKSLDRRGIKLVSSNPDEVEEQETPYEEKELILKEKLQELREFLEQSLSLDYVGVPLNDEDVFDLLMSSAYLMNKSVDTENNREHLIVLTFNDFISALKIGKIDRESSLMHMENTIKLVELMNWDSKNKILNMLDLAERKMIPMNMGKKPTLDSIKRTLRGTRISDDPLN